MSIFNNDLLDTADNRATTVLQWRAAQDRYIREHAEKITEGKYGIDIEWLNAHSAPGTFGPIIARCRSKWSSLEIKYGHGFAHVGQPCNGRFVHYTKKCADGVTKSRVFPDLFKAYTYPTMIDNRQCPVYLPSTVVLRNITNWPDCMVDKSNDSQWVCKPPYDKMVIYAYNCVWHGEYTGNIIDGKNSDIIFDDMDNVYNW